MAVNTVTARVACPQVHQLAEGPVWDATAGRVRWVDIEAGDVLTGVLIDHRVEVVDRAHVDEYAGAVAPAADGRLLVAGRSSLFVLSSDGRLDRSVDVIPADSDRRLNDGACDPAGRFLVGSLSLGEASGREVLRRVEDDGTVSTLDDDLWLSNGLAWSPDGGLLYSVDTLPAVVWVRAYDVATGAVGPRREHVRLDDGSPDGICTDAEGNLWVAVFGRGQVRCLGPDGRQLHAIDVPAPNTTSVAFVGSDLGTLLITTGSVELDDAARAAYPDSGRLFTAPVGEVFGLHGVPCAPWNGTVPSPSVVGRLRGIERSSGPA